MRELGCVFCEIAAGDAPAEMINTWVDYNVMAFRPLNPVTQDHILVAPMEHLNDALADSERTATTMMIACRIAMAVAPNACNIITSVGEMATQTIRHLHIHVVPREEGDGLLLPWSFQKGSLLTIEDVLVISKAIEEYADQFH